MSPDLYRKEAFQSRVKGFSNPVSIRGSLSATVMMLGLIGLIASLFAYSWATPYTRKVVVPGYIAPKSGRVSITSPVDGIARVSVANGARVRKGDVVAMVVDELSDTGATSLSTLMLDDLHSRTKILDKRAALLERRVDSVGNTYATRRTQALRQVEAGERLLAMQNHESAIAAGSRDRVLRMVDGGLDTQRNLEQAEMQVIVAGQSVIDAEVALFRARDTLGTIAVDRDMELNTLEQETLAVEAERVDVANKIRRLEAERHREILAPLDGIVTVGTARSRERVAAGAPLFTIDPTGEDYAATLFAPSSAIGFVAPGDTVSIRYRAYPYREHGIFRGTVNAIDNTAQTPSEIGAPVSVAEPVYRISVEIDQSPRGKSGGLLALRSGMLLEASVVADEKPILFWLLDPVL